MRKPSTTSRRLYLLNDSYRTSSWMTDSNVQKRARFWHRASCYYFFLFLFSPFSILTRKRDASILSHFSSSTKRRSSHNKELLSSILLEVPWRRRMHSPSVLRLLPGGGRNLEQVHRNVVHPVTRFAPKKRPPLPHSLIVENLYSVREEELLKDIVQLQSAWESVELSCTGYERCAGHILRLFHPSSSKSTKKPFVSRCIRIRRLQLQDESSTDGKFLLRALDHCCGRTTGRLPPEPTPKTVQSKKPSKHHDACLLYTSPSPRD